MSTEISTRAGGGLALATFDDAFRFAKMVSQSEFAPKVTVFGMVVVTLYGTPYTVLRVTISSRKAQ